MSDHTIYPTGNCFDDALEYLSERVAKDRILIDSGTLVLVHAIVLQPDGPDEGKPFAHAWVEEGGRMFQGGIYQGERIIWSADKDEILSALRVQEFARYTPREAAVENKRTRHFGPWLEKFEALCKPKEKP